MKKPFDIVEVVQCAHALTGKWSLFQQTRLHAENLESTVRTRTAELEAANKMLECEIVERKRSAEALRFTQFSVDNAAHPMFWVAPNSALLYVNAATCELLNFTVAELQAMSVTEIVPEILMLGWDSVWEATRTERHRNFEATHLARNGGKIPIELTATFFSYEGQELLCVSTRDITVRKQILEELYGARDSALESVRLKSQFLANMSHEIRTPMNGMIGMAELMLHTNLDREQREYLDTIRSSADLLLNIINDILDTAKIESGVLRFETIDFNLNDVIEGTMEIVGSGARNKGLEMAGYVQGNVHPHLRGDPGRLRQVLTNIVSNAVKFTSEGEVVLSVSTLVESEDMVQLCFEVRDTGIGIATEARARIFEPFMQADPSDTRKYGGTGLGLTICKQIVDAQGGSIGLESELGKGSTFWFTLNFKKQAMPQGKPVRPVDNLTGIRVLVVDDNPTNREILKLQLTTLNMRPSSVARGDQALDILRSEGLGSDPFHLAVLDGRMPGMDGMELARQIKSEPGISSTRLILLSSLGDHWAETTLAAAGIEGYLTKPLKQTRLQSALASLFSSEPMPIPPPRAKRPEPDVEIAPDATLTAGRPLHILLAEDNAINQRVAILQLKRLGYTADVANDGVEALKALEKFPYDVILMDCQMPNMDGYTATREIRRIYQRPILIIAMTANAMQGDKEKCLAAGMDEHLSKPVDTKLLGRLLVQRQSANLPSEPSAEVEESPAGAEPVDLERFLEITGNQFEMQRQIANDYLEQAEEILAHIALAIERRSATEIQQLAHKLSGSSSTCGMRAIVSTMKRLEKIEVITDFTMAASLHLDAVYQLISIRQFLIRHLDSVPELLQCAP